MVVRKKNLLDAFQASAPEGRAALRRTEDARASAGGPFAPSANAHDAARAPRFPTGARVPVWRRALADRAVQVALAVGVVALAGAYCLARGRSSATAEAAGRSSESAPESAGALLRPTPAPRAGAEADLAKLNAANARVNGKDDLALMDPANKYTVRVKTFGNDPAGRAAALALRDYLIKEAFPAVSPIELGKHCVVCVGHTDKKKDADAIAASIQKLRGPPPDAKKSAFDDAYVVNIDDVVKRK
jgi:putative hemolysin